MIFGLQKYNLFLNIFHVKKIIFFKLFRFSIVFNQCNKKTGL